MLVAVAMTADPPSGRLLDVLVWAGELRAEHSEGLPTAATTSEQAQGDPSSLHRLLPAITASVGQGVGTGRHTHRPV